MWLMRYKLNCICSRLPDVCSVRKQAGDLDYNKNSINLVMQETSKLNALGNLIVCCENAWKQNVGMHEFQTEF